MYLLKHLFLFGVVAFLSACGGGGGGDSDVFSPEDPVQPVAEAQNYDVGDFNVDWDKSRLLITQNGRTLWKSREGAGFVSGGVHAMEAEEGRGSFSIRENIEALCDDMVLSGFEKQNNQLLLTGVVSGESECQSNFTLLFEQVSEGHLQFKLSFSNPSINLSRLVYSSDQNERFHGFGEQYTHLDLKGHEVQVLSEEGGIFRNEQTSNNLIDSLDFESGIVNTVKELLTNLINIVTTGSGGDEYTTYYAVPQYITNTLKSLFLENTEYAVFDLRDQDSVEVRVFHDSMTGRILYGESMLGLIERFTEYTGRMRPLPDWFNQGAVLGIQGGTDKVTGILDELETRGTPVSGVWLQDWVGKRKTAAGSQLWWNWELDNDQYPNWHDLVDRIEGTFDAKVLCYINAFLVDPTVGDGAKTNVVRNLYTEAIDNGYLVKNEEGAPLQVASTDFDAGMVDFTNPEAQTWIKSVMKDNMIRDARCGGWMHDFGEALPFEAHLYSEVEAASYHNQYTVDWAQMGREAIEEAKSEGLVDFDVVFFNRAGYTKTPNHSTLLWQGDQMVTWDIYDGLQSAINATLTGGFSGLSLNHSDIGGYTNISPEILGFTIEVFNRDLELLLRWMEFAAFTVAYRTHEGIIPETNAQFYDKNKFDHESCRTRFAPDENINYTHFDKFARVYNALAFYRKTLMEEAQTKGWPVVRHPMLHYPDDEQLAALQDHIMLGEEILMAPFIEKTFCDETKEWRQVYFPDAANTTWVHIFTGDEYGKGESYETPAGKEVLSGNYRWVYAPYGTPAAFYRKSWSGSATLETNLKDLGVKQ